MSLNIKRLGAVLKPFSNTIREEDTCWIFGAGVKAKDREGLTALQWAQGNQHADVVAILKKAGATP